MQSHETVLRQPSTGQVLELSAAVNQQLARVLRGASFDDVKTLIGRKSAIGRALRDVLKPEPPPAFPLTLPSDEVLRSYERLYTEVFEVKRNLDGIEVPRAPVTYWPVVRLLDLDAERLFAGATKLFGEWKHGTWKYGTLDVEATPDRKRSEDYCVAFAPNLAADPDLANLSANDLEERKVPGITLEERIILEIRHFRETGGGHLDPRTVTLCSGSRYSVGDVPGVDWGVEGGGFCMGAYYPRSAGDSLRSRRAVS